MHRFRSHACYCWLRRIQTFRWGAGGGGASYPDPQIRGQSPKMFFSAFQSSVWSENKVGGGGQGPSPGSATDRVPDKTCFAGQTFEVWQPLKQTVAPKVTLFTSFSSAHSAHLLFFLIFTNISCSETADLLLRIILWSFPTPEILLQTSCVDWRQQTQGTNKATFTVCHSGKL